MVQAGWRAVVWAAILVVAAALGPAALCAPQEYRDKHFDYFVAGDPAAPGAARTRGGIALMGGGGTVDAAYRFIAERAGHGHILVLGADSDGQFDPSLRKYDESFMTRWGPVVSAETIVFHDRDAASDPRVIEALRRADGIFLMGGDQGDYVRYWRGTPVQAALDAHVRAGRPIGGSSAGLAVLGRYVYGCLDGHSLESREALADPFNPSVTLVDDFLHFDPLGSVVTDTHFGERHRLGRLSVFVARFNRDHPGAEIVGVGVDEATALLVDPDGKAVLAPGSRGSVWLVGPTRPAKLAPGTPFTARGLRLRKLGADSRLDLAAGRVEAPLADQTMRIVGGVLQGKSAGAAIFTRGGPAAGED